MTKQENPQVGQFVLDKYDKKRKKVQAYSNGLYFIGQDHEPVFRWEFAFTQNEKKCHGNNGA